ncbi:ABC transporter permease [Rummeliibacillus suwonensis]|uniref:ABC transporter permease n=1 Tax=Rummeliibacillus suwonensis TaxID=1306154 RepID=UPI001AAE7EFA|nr:ABC transporter permease [Rummeliibacillus suwonensis]MBO2535847.1 ABC transporter permease [Rummeliibacillus suwonensis]
MRFFALVTRIMQQMFRDKRTMALLFLAPLLVLTLMYFIFHSDEVDTTLGVVGLDEKVVTLIEHGDINVKKYDHLSQQQALDDKLDGWLKVENGKVLLTLQNDQPSRAKALQLKLKQALSGQQQAAMQISVDYVYGDEDTALFDVISPILVSFFVFFFVFLIAGIALLKERTTGTLERLLSTPIRRFEVVFGYVVGYGIFAIIQTLLVIFYAVKVLDVVLVGSIWHVLIINICLAFVALSLGILLSSFASSEFQMVQFIPLVIIPQIFFTGIFPMDGMADWLVNIGKIMPLYYASDAMTGVMYKGYQLNEIVSDLGVLLGFACVFIVFNILSLKKYRTL